MGEISELRCVTGKNFLLVEACAANFASEYSTSVRLLVSLLITHQDLIHASNCQIVKLPSAEAT